MATQSSILDWRIAWTEDPGGAIVYRIAKSGTRLKRLSTNATGYLEAANLRRADGVTESCA